MPSGSKCGAVGMTMPVTGPLIPSSFSGVVAWACSWLLQRAALEWSGLPHGRHCRDVALVHLRPRRVRGHFRGN